MTPAPSFTPTEECFRFIWEHSLDGMRLTDEDGIMIMVNDAFCCLVGKTREELIGQPLSVIYQTDHAPVMAKHNERFAARNVAPLFERELFLWHGRKVWFELSNSFIEVPNQPVVLLSLFRDITDRRLAEEKMRDFSARLERSNRELQDFAYVASHDLQEPLRKVTVFGDRLKTKFNDTLGDVGRDYLDRMLKATDRMQSLINELLTYSRVASKSHSFAQVDLAEAAREVVGDLEARVEQVSAKVEIGALGTIEAESLQIRQLFQNLIGNALKFHRPGVTPRITLEAATFTEPAHVTVDGLPRDMLRLTVADNGIGFEEKYAERIFQVFQRLHSRAAYEGTGMGLAIARKIVERHGGVIAAKSAPGEGATFTITLPVKQPHLPNS